MSRSTVKRWHRESPNHEFRKCEAETVATCTVVKRAPETALHASSYDELVALAEAQDQHIANQAEAAANGVHYGFLAYQQTRKQELDTLYDSLPRRFLTSGTLFADYQDAFETAQAENPTPSPDSIGLSTLYLRERARNMVFHYGQPSDDTKLTAQDVDTIANDLGYTLIDDTHRTIRLYQHTHPTSHIIAVNCNGKTTSKRDWANIGNLAYETVNGYTNQEHGLTAFTPAILAAIHRCNTHTGVNLIGESEYLLPRQPGTDHYQRYLTDRALLTTVATNSAERYNQATVVRNQITATVTATTSRHARVFETKTNITKRTQALMDTHTIGNHFRAVEIDDDVTTEDWHDFQHAITTTAPKLPLPGDAFNHQKPELRVRFLGRHNADGLYFPQHNCLCVDARTSGAFIHEYGHYLDHSIKGDASLQTTFTSIRNRYTHNLTIPTTLTGRDGDPAYYTRPSEILARGFELYCVEKLGINNRLVDINKHNNFDYEPFHKDPTLKTDIYTFITNTFTHP